MTIDERKEDTLRQINTILGDISIDDLHSDGFTIRSGNKVLKLSVTEELSIENIEEDVRRELSEKLSERLTKIGEVVKKKLDDMSNFVSTLKTEYEEETRQLEERLKSNEIMPNITHEHAVEGLSLAKGYDNRLHWYFQSVYWPKYIDGCVIDPSYSKRLINHILIVVETYGKNVMSVKVRKPIGLSTFQHYHTDCWGNWEYSREWNTPDDIIQICKEAEVVLETINTGSLANSSPRGLMRINTLQKHVRPETNDESFTTNRRSENMGVTNDFTRDNVWRV